MCIQPAASMAFAVASGVVPVAEHDAVAAGALLARRAARDDRAVAGSTILISTCGCGRPTVSTRLLERVVRRRLRRDRRGLGHAADDGHLAHVHPRLHLLHHSTGHGRAGHDAGAQRRQIELGEPRVAELGDEHRRHAVERRAALGLHGLEHRERVERFRRHDDARAAAGAAEVAEHHAEAVVERHRHADAVALGVAQPTRRRR